MKNFLTILVLLPLTASYSSNVTPPQVGGCSAIIKVLLMNADIALRGCIKNADLVFKGCIGNSQTKNVIKNSWESLHEENLTKHIFKMGLDNSSQYSSFENIVQNPQLLIAMPTNHEKYLKVYNKQRVPFSAEKEILEFNTMINESENTSRLNYGVVELQTYIERSLDEFIVIFAHSEENGVKVILPNGEPIIDKEIHQICIENQKTCVVLTCYGDDFELKDRIVAKEALSMWQYAFELHLKSEKMSIEEYIYNMRVKRSSMQRNKRIQIFISASGTTGGIGYYYSSEHRK